MNAVMNICQSLGAGEPRRLHHWSGFKLLAKMLVNEGEQEPNIWDKELVRNISKFQYRSNLQCSQGNLYSMARR